MGETRKVSEDQVRRLGWIGATIMLFLVISSMAKTVLCREAAGNYSVANVSGEVFASFHAVAIKRHSSMRN
jgi:hypothetical protein